MSFATNVSKWNAIFGVVILLCSLSVENVGGKQLVVSWGIVCVWDTGHFVVQRNIQWGDRMLSQTAATYTGMWCAPGECWEGTCKAILRGVWNCERTGKFRRTCQKPCLQTLYSLWGLLCGKNQKDVLPGNKAAYLASWKENSTLTEDLKLK